MKPGSFLLSNTIILCFLSLIVVYSSSGLKGHDLGASASVFFTKRVLAMTIGILVIGCLSQIHRNLLRHISIPLSVASLILLGLVIIPGVYVSVGGAVRWIDIGFMRFQPSEIAKLSMIFLIADGISRCRGDINSLRFLFFVASSLAICGFFLFLQKDYGSIVLIFSTIFLMLYSFGLRALYIVISVAVFTIFSIVAIAAEPYRIKRIVGFVDPWSHYLDSGFQIVQAFLAINSGGIFGLGLGESKQKLSFLPEIHTDFIVAMVTEELGIIGIFVIMTIIGNIVNTAMSIGRSSTSMFESSLCLGIAYLIFLQTIINLLVVSGMAPTKGIPFPFLSSGSSSLIMSLVCVGIIYRISSFSRPTEH